MRPQRHNFIRPIFIDVIPDQLEEGVLYICNRYATALHKCCCGCGEEVVTPLSPADWTVHKRGRLVSLSPSVGNWSLACRSHYLISDNQVIWARMYTPSQIEQVKIRDRADKEAYIASINLQKSKEAGFWARLLQFVRNIFN